MKTNREKATTLLEKLTNEGDGLTHQVILEYLIFNYMEGSEAYQALLAAEKEFFDWENDDFDDEEFGGGFDDED
jgi:hypothetical protein